MPALASMFLWPAGRPQLVLGFAILLALWAAAQLVDWHDGRLRLEVDPSVRALLPRGGEEIERYESIRERYASDDLLLVAWTGADLFTPERLAALKRLTRSIEKIPGVDEVESLATALRVQVYDDYSDVSGYLSESPENIVEAEAIRDAVLADPLYAGYLVARDGTGVMLAVHFDPRLSARALIELVAEIAAMSKAEARGIEQYLSGPLYVRLEISRLLLRDLFRVMPLAVIATLIVVAAGFRHWHGVVLPLVSNAIALVLTLLAFQTAGHSLNYVTVILPPTIYVVGFAYAIHVVSDFDRNLRRLGDQTQAIKAALSECAIPVTLTALTTAIGFASLTISSIDSIRIFGLYASLGTVLAWLGALLVVPAGLQVCRDGHFKLERDPRDLASWSGPLANLATNRGGLLLTAGAVAVVAAVVGAGQIEVSTDYLDNFAPDNAVRVDFERMSSVFSGAVPLQVVIEGPSQDVFKTPTALREIERLKSWLQHQSEVGGVYTLLDYVGVLERALAPDLVDDDPVPASAGVISHLILLGGGEEVSRFAEPGFNSSLLQVRANVVASAELNALSDRIEGRLERLPEGYRGYVTGSSHVIARTLDSVTRGQVLSLLAALIPIYVVLMLMFRSIRLGTLALIPNVLPILAFFGILGFSGVTLNLTTSLVASVVLGIAVDDSIHFFARLKANARTTPSRHAAIRMTLAQILRPVTFTTIALGCGFITLISGELKSQIEFGLLAAVTLIIAWVLDITFTPALAARFGVAHEDSSQ